MPLFDWIEIPVEDLDRAARFYSAVLETDLEVTELQPGYRVAFLPIPEDTPAGPGGMLVETEGFGPAGEQGCRVCFGAAADIDGFLMRVEEAGGPHQPTEDPIGRWGLRCLLGVVLRYGRKSAGRSRTGLTVVWGANQ